MKIHMALFQFPQQIYIICDIHLLVQFIYFYIYVQHRTLFAGNTEKIKDGQHILTGVQTFTGKTHIHSHINLD